MSTSFNSFWSRKYFARGTKIRSVTSNKKSYFSNFLISIETTRYLVVQKPFNFLWDINTSVSSNTFYTTVRSFEISRWWHFRKENNELIAKKIFFTLTLFCPRTYTWYLMSNLQKWFGSEIRMGRHFWCSIALIFNRTFSPFWHLRLLFQKYQKPLSSFLLLDPYYLCMFEMRHPVFDIPVVLICSVFFFAFNSPN